MTVLELGPDNGTYEWRLIYPNDYTCKFFKSSRENLNGYTAHERSELPQRREFYEACKKSKQGYQSEVNVGRLFNPLGKTVITYLGTNPFTSGDLFALILWNSDNLPQNRVRLLELSEFFDKSPTMMGAVILQKGQLSILYSNKKASDFLEVQKGKVNASSCTPLELLGLNASLFMESRKTLETPKEHQYYIIGPEGNQKFVRVSITAVSYDEKEDCSKHMYIMCNLTAQKNAELALERHKNSLEETVKARTLELQDKEETLRSIIENAPNIILMVNKEGIIQNFEGGPTNIVGKHLQTLVVEEMEEKFKLLFENKKKFRIDVKLVNSNTFMKLSAGPINDNMATVVATDIKQMSEELHHALATKSRFLANMSHEVRTPLSGIIGMARILLETGLNQDQTECVSTIQSCGECLLSVINDVLDYTKLDATGSSTMIENAEISLCKCVEESLYTILPAAEKKQLELIVDIDANVHDRIMGDMLRLRQVIVNLLNNSVKFTDAGYILLTLNAAQINGGKEWKYNFTIKDTGVGISRDSQGKLFQMFSQVDTSPTRRFGGTGIGLALAKRLLEMMNGDITIDSTGVPGEGCTFRFSITATTVPYTPLPSLPSPEWLLASTYVFIIDDVPIAAEILKKRLEDIGLSSVNISVIPVLKNAFRTLEKYVLSLSLEDQQNKHVVVFCNINKITPHCKCSLMDNPNVVLVLMGYTRDKDHDTQFPKHEFLRKPIKKCNLVRCLRDIWSRFDSSIQRSKEFAPCVMKLKQEEDVGCPLNVLVVEDNEMNQKVIRRVFQHLGYPCVGMANHGLEALEYIEKNGLPDLIFMDVQMPVLDGIQTTKVIRSKYVSNWPFICSMTADAFPEDRKNCLEAGMNDFLTKPIRVEQVQTTLQKCCSLKHNVHVIH